MTTTTTPIHDAARTLLGGELSDRQVADLNIALAEQPVEIGGDWRVGYASFGDVASIRTAGPGLADLTTCRRLGRTIRRICPVPHTLMAVHVPSGVAHDLDTHATMTVIPPGDDCESGGFDVDLGDGHDPGDEHKEGAD